MSVPGETSFTSTGSTPSTPIISDSETSEAEGPTEINVEEWLKNNRLKKLIPKFNEDEIMIEELIQLAENEHTLKKYAIDTLKINDQMYLQRFMNAVISSRIEFLNDLNSDRNNNNTLNIDINGSPVNPSIRRAQSNSITANHRYTTKGGRRHTRKHKRIGSLNLALRSAPTIVKIHVVVTEEETNMLKLLDKKIKSTGEMISKLKHASEQTMVDYETLKSNINEKYNNLIEIINVQREALKRKILNIKNDNILKNNNNVKLLKQYLNKLESERDEIQDIIYNNSSKDITSRKNKIMTKGNNILNLKNKIDDRDNSNNFNIKLSWNQKEINKFIKSNLGKLIGDSILDNNVQLKAVNVSLKYTNLNTICFHWELKKDDKKRDNEYFIVSYKKQINNYHSSSDEDETKVSGNTNKWFHSDIINNKFSFILSKLEINTNYCIKIGRLHSNKISIDSLNIDNICYSDVLICQTQNVKFQLNTNVLNKLQINHFLSILDTKFKRLHKNVSFISYKPLYNSQVNKFNSKSFHKHCDNKGPTLMLLKSKIHNHIFGAYTSKSYTSPKSWKCVSDKYAFLFLITGRESILKKYNISTDDLPLIFDIVNVDNNVNRALWHYKYSFPLFGECYDLSLKGNDISKDNSCNSNMFPYSYWKYKNGNQSDLLSGSQTKFSCLQCEVFSVRFT